MSISRRDLLKGAAVAGAALAVPGDAEAREKREPSPEAVGMLFDATRCVGCRACQSACKRENKLPPDRVDANGGVYDAPVDLNSTTKNVIKAVPAAGKDPVYMKQQCMHCVDPSCVSVCMLGALHKEGAGKRDMGGERKGTGIVLWDKELCLGCRYCQIACAFNVPKFEWLEAFPAIVKCELCRHRKDGPACCQVCPRGAVVWGKRSDLLAEARRRLAADPGRYLPHVYGEDEGGGTQVLYLAAVSFEKLGLPSLGKESLPEGVHKVQGALYRGFVAPLALFGCLGLAIRQRMNAVHAHDEKHARDHEQAGQSPGTEKPR